MSTAREEVLARVRAALEITGGTSVPRPVPRDYRRTAEQEPGSPELLDLLVDRLLDYRAGVTRTFAVDLPATLARVLADGLARSGALGEHGPRPRLVLPPQAPPSWEQAVLRVAEVVRDLTPDALSTLDLDAVAGVLTGAAVAVAETGTIVLDASGDQGRRALTLVPDLHVCVVRADQVVQGVPEAVARLDPRRPLTWISGPSATSDIELQRVEGVHGPRTLEVVLVES